jgi:hypothetical protein
MTRAIRGLCVKSGTYSERVRRVMRAGGCARLIARKSGVVRTRSPSEENRTASIVGALGDGTA